MSINGGGGINGSKFSNGGFLPATMLWQGASTNMILAHPSQVGRRKSLGLPPGNRIPGSLFAQDFMNLYAQGVHPAGLVYEIGSRLGYDSRSMQFSLNKMNNEIISALQKSGDLTPQEYDQIVSNVMEKNLLQIKRNSPSLGRNVSLFEEIQQLGFTRNTSKIGRAHV